jgi:hypothetical protein
VHDPFVTYTLEATDSQVDQLRGITDIKDIVKVDLKHWPEKRDDMLLVWMFASTDMNDDDELVNTAAYLQSLTVIPIVCYDYRNAFHPVLFWGVQLTQGDRDTAVKHPGVAWAEPTGG